MFLLLYHGKTQDKYLPRSRSKRQWDAARISTPELALEGMWGVNKQKPPFPACTVLPASHAPFASPPSQSVPSCRKPSQIDGDGDLSVLNGAGPQVTPATRVDRVRLSPLPSFRDESKTIARGMERGYTIFSAFFPQHFHTGALRIK